MFRSAEPASKTGTVSVRPAAEAVAEAFELTVKVVLLLIAEIVAFVQPPPLTSWPTTSPAVVAPVPARVTRAEPEVVLTLSGTVPAALKIRLVPCAMLTVPRDSDDGMPARPVKLNVAPRRLTGAVSLMRLRTLCVPTLLSRVSVA